MLKKIMMASVAVGALALNAPAALADEPTIDCSFDSLQQEDATGQNYEGAATGVVAHAGDGTVTIQCYIKVNNVATGAATPVGSGPAGVAATAGRVTFAADDDDVVQLCARGTTSHGAYDQCATADHQQIPPQEVIDAIDGVFDLLAEATKPLDKTTCDALKAAGTPALINGSTGTTGYSMDTDDCDLYEGGVRVIDFDPYED